MKKNNIESILTQHNNFDGLIEAWQKFHEIFKEKEEEVNKKRDV